MSSLSFKWGTLKGWSSVNKECIPLLEKYFADGVPLGCASDRPTEDRKKILCEAIDLFIGELHNDWTGKQMTKDEAKKYVMEYDQ